MSFHFRNVINIMPIKYILIYITICYLIPIECKKPYEKNKLTTWHLECELGIISDTECPVDGGWSAWTSWTDCQGPCDEIGHRKRTRECMNPFPSRNGLPCTGPDYEIESCYLSNCTIEDFRLLVKGDLARTAGLRQLEAVSTLAQRCLQMQCPFEAIEAALVAENTWQLNAEELWNALLCVKRNLGCPITGQWSAWSPWTICGARCGKGLRWRQRNCNTPPPSDARLICSGSPLQYEECEGDQCAIEKPYIEHMPRGSWSQWAPWTGCSESCGVGVRRRKRTCIENYTPHSFFTWSTNCRGQHDQLDTCSNKKCNLDGGWSGWSAWGACSQTCGAGKRSRLRSCTRPIPFGDGANCIGLRTEVGSCHLKPCEVYTHVVSFFNGDSTLEFNFPKEHYTFFHFYTRFMPLSSTGIIVRRRNLNYPFIHLLMHKWHLCLDITASSKCILPRICSPNTIDPAIWHTVLITFTNDAALLRINDAQIPLKCSVSCDPELEKKNFDLTVGERFHGAVQEIILNFVQLNMFIKQERQTRTLPSNLFPITASNIIYDKANLDEAFIFLENDYYIRIPCFNDSEESWQMKLTLYPKTSNGLILIIYDNSNDNWILLALHNLHLKIKLKIGEWKPESLSSTEHQLEQWLDLCLAKKKSANVIEATINDNERLHIFLNDWQKQRGVKYKPQNFVVNSSQGLEIICGDVDEKNTDIVHNFMNRIKCSDEFYIGNMPFYIKGNVSEDFLPFSGIIASIHINGVLLNLNECSKERNKGDSIQLSSRTASISGSYQEIMWGKSNVLNLTCLYTKTFSLSKRMSDWLNLDITLTRRLSSNNLTIYNDGMILKLSLPGHKELRGFYTCRSLFNDRTRNLITYGVTGKFENKLTGPDFTTTLAVFTTLSLVIFTLGWLIIEGINDLRDGYGFFRDIHLTPEKEAEAVCSYIDKNIHLLRSKSAAKIAKARARRKARQLASRTSFAAQEPEGLMEIDKCNNDDDSVIEAEALSEPLPKLPDITNLKLELSHQVFRCEPSYVSSPRHGSILTSPETKITSSSSVENSPSNLYSKLLMNKTKSLFKHRIKNEGSTNISKLLTIKSSSLMNLSPGQRILQKFQQLKVDDP